MTSPIVVPGPGESLQRIRRNWTDEFTDQHGRRFAAQYDIGNSRPIGELAPVGFSPPWLPPMRFIMWERHGSFRFRWDYTSMATELAEQSDALYGQVMEFMIEHMPNVEIPEVGDPIPAKARRLFRAPMSPAIPLAAEAGDPWILGVPGAQVNELLRDILAQSVHASGREAVALIRARIQKQAEAAGIQLVATRPVESVPSEKAKTINSVDLTQIAAVSYQEFIGAAMRDGMTMAAAAVAWKAHRENVALEQSA